MEEHIEVVQRGNRGNRATKATEATGQPALPALPGCRSYEGGTVNANEVNCHFDLLSLAEKDTELRKTGTWLYGPCPFCGGLDRFLLKKDIGGWRWYCRKCGDDKYHSPLDYIMRREALDFRQALAWAERELGELPGLGPSTEREVERWHERPMDTIPPEAWQRRARQFLDESQSHLQLSVAGIEPIAYLIDRGLRPETIREYGLGYNPVDRFEDLSAWGFPEEYNARGNLKKVWLPRGIVIPCFVGGTLWYLKIRRFITESQISTGEQKYIKVKGSKPGLFGAENLTKSAIAVFTEGEFDAMLLGQESTNLVGVASLGSATDRISRLDMSFWGRYILPLSHILTAYDNDEEGRRGSEQLAAFSGRVKHMRLPEMRGVKDITDLWSYVSSLSTAWLKPELRRLGILSKPEPSPISESPNKSMLETMLGMGGVLRGSWPAESAPINPWLAIARNSPVTYANTGGDSHPQ